MSKEQIVVLKHDTAQEFKDAGIASLAIGGIFAAGGAIIKGLGYLKRRKLAKKEGEGKESK